MEKETFTREDIEAIIGSNAADDFIKRYLQLLRRLLLLVSRPVKTGQHMKITEQWLHAGLSNSPRGGAKEEISE